MLLLIIYNRLCLFFYIVMFSTIIFRLLVKTNWGIFFFKNKNLNYHTSMNFINKSFFPKIITTALAVLILIAGIPELAIKRCVDLGDTLNRAIDKITDMNKDFKFNRVEDGGGETGINLDKVKKTV